MMPVLGNPAGLWALLALPAILAVHFLQQRARVVRTSTWFLIEKLAPDSARGRTWDRLRSSRTLWLQLLAVLALTWVIIEPRWLRWESVQNVVVVLDASASMAAFQPDAAAAVRREMDAADGFAARTTWVLMTTDARQPALYRGPDKDAARKALAAWRPELGFHDPGPALRVARGLAGEGGTTLLVTDSRAGVPPDQRAVGVGQPIENVGFAGATVTRTPSGWLWRALVKNHAGTPQRRNWELLVGDARVSGQTLDLLPGALTEITAPWPDAVEEFVVLLSPDGFAADDRLPLVRPVPKPLRVAVEGDDAAAEFFTRVARAVDGVTLSGPADVAEPGTKTPVLRVARLDHISVQAEDRGGIFWPPADRRRQIALMTEPIVAERHPLVEGLNWQAWIGGGPDGFPQVAGDVPLLWQGRWPLVFVRPGKPAGEGANAGVPKLMLAFDWDNANAGRLPAMVLLVERFLTAQRDAQRAPFAGNFDTSASIALAAAIPAGELELSFRPADGGTAASTRTIRTVDRAEVRAPSSVGFFTISRGAEPLVRGAAQFADPREGDFSAAASFTQELPSERTAAMQRNTRPDPAAPAWLVVLAGLLVASWWTRRGPAPAVSANK